MNSDTNSTPFVPEKLNLWDRVFNRRRKIVHDRGCDEVRVINIGLLGERLPDERKYHNWIEYRVIDRLTGSETIKREYLN